jgi:beta-mannosidase
LDYQTRKLRNHPFIALWCGNKEIQWSFDEWWESTGYYGSKIYNYVAPETVRRNCPDIPYWNSSPYGGVHTNDCESGDRQHHNNTFEKDTVLAGITYHYCGTASLDIDGYLPYAGLCQGLMYAYSLKFFRYNLECSRGLNLVIQK